MFELVCQIFMPFSSFCSACAAPIDNRADAINPNVTKVVMDSRHYAIYFSRALIPNNKQGEWRESVKYFKNCGMYW